MAAQASGPSSPKAVSAAAEKDPTCAPPADATTGQVAARSDGRATHYHRVAIHGSRGRGPTLGVRDNGLSPEATAAPPPPSHPPPGYEHEFSIAVLLLRYRSVGRRSGGASGRHPALAWGGTGRTCPCRVRAWGDLMVAMPPRGLARPSHLIAVDECSDTTYKFVHATCGEFTHMLVVTSAVVRFRYWTTGDTGPTQTHTIPPSERMAEGPTGDGQGVALSLTLKKTCTNCHCACVHHSTLDVSEPGMTRAVWWSHLATSPTRLHIILRGAVLERIPTSAKIAG